MAHPEPLFLVNNQQTQVLEFHILGQHSVGSDDNIRQALLQFRHGFADFPRRPETAHQFHMYGKILHALDKGGIMLLGQNGGGYQIHHLFSLLYRLERRPQGNLRLAVAHVTADQPVHDFPALHVGLGVHNGGQLGLCLLKGKHFFKFPLPHRILFKRITRALLSYGI